MLSALLLAAAFAPTPEVATLAVRTWGPYFESNKSGLKGDSSFLVITDADKMAAVLRPVPPIGGRKTESVPKDAFDKSIILAVIKRGTQTYDYTFVKAEARDGVVRVEIKSVAKGDPNGSATFATPYVLTIPKGKWKSVEFIDNGKKAATVKLAE